MEGTIRKLVLAVLMVVAWVGGVPAATPPPQVTPLSPVVEGLRAPVRIAADGAGNLYVTDPRGGGIVRFTATGRFDRLIPTARAPQGIAVTASGNLLVSQGDFVALIDQTGKELRRLGAGAGQFRMANGIALDAAGRMYVTDSLANSVQVFTAAGDYVSRFGSAGFGSGQFNMPTGIAYEKVAGHLAVVDSLNGRVQFFDTNGIFQRTLCSFGSGPLKLTFPHGITFEYTTGASPALLRMYVADSFQSTIQVVDPAGSGSFLAFIGSYGAGIGQLNAPSDALYDPAASRLVVANGSGNLVLFGIGAGYLPVDTTPPELTLDPLPVSTFTASLSVGGYVEPGALVTVSVNGGAAKPAVTSGSGWNATVTLTPGLNSVTVKATDAAGNVTTTVGSVVLTVTNTFFSIGPVPALVNTNGVTLTGSRSAGVTISVVNGTTGASATVTYPTGTTWRSVLSGLAEGGNVITLSSGSVSESLVVTVDTRAPQLVVSSLKTGSRSGVRVHNVTVAASDPHLQGVTVNGKQVPLVNGTASMPLVLANGATTLAVTATDQAGNSVTDSRSFTYDPLAPELAVVAPSDGSHTRTPVVEVAGTAAAGATVSVTGLAATVTDGGWSRRVTLVPGLNTIEIRAASPSGASASLKRTVFYDPDSPQAVIVSPAEDMATVAESVLISGAVEDGVTISATVNGTAVPVALTGSAFSINVPLGQEGSHTVTVTAIDATGASSGATRSLVVDRTPPLLLITGQTAPPPAVLTGTAGRDATVTVSDRSGVLGVSANADGTWSVNLAGTPHDPASLRITAADAAGNVTVRALTAPVPTGDLNNDGKVTMVDALRVLRIAVGLVAPTADDYAAADVGPLVNGEVRPDGKIDLQDAILIMRKSVGVQTW
jgi:hypothetical protein